MMMIMEMMTRNVMMEKVMEKRSGYIERDIIRTLSDELSIFVVFFAFFSLTELAVSLSLSAV